MIYIRSESVIHPLIIDSIIRLNNFVSVSLVINILSENIFGESFVCLGFAQPTNYFDFVNWKNVNEHIMNAFYSDRVKN